MRDMVCSLLIEPGRDIVTQNEARKLRTVAPMNMPLANSDTCFSADTATVGKLRLRLFTDLEAIKLTWMALENSGVSTVYQSFEWCQIWLRRVGQPRNISPCIVIAEDVFGNVMFVLPLQLRHKFTMRIIESLTAPQGAYGFGLFNRAFLSGQAAAWFENHFSDVVSVLPKHDVLHLSDIPHSMQGHASPLLSVQCFLAANHSHIMNLQPDYNALLEEKRSPESRRSMRKRDTKLQSSGRLTFELPHASAEKKATIEIMLAHQKARLAEVGVHGVFDALEQQFITDLIQAETPEGPLVRPYRLMLDGIILAVMLGAYRHGTYWALISSLAEGELRKYSPGDYALRAMFKSLCEDGTTRLDFSAGDTAYKSNWSDHRFQLYFIVRATSFRGLPFAIGLLLREKIKRIAKTTPVLNTLLFDLRRLLRGQKV